MGDTTPSSRRHADLASNETSPRTGSSSIGTSVVSSETSLSEQTHVGVCRSTKRRQSSVAFEIGDPGSPLMEQAPYGIRFQTGSDEVFPTDDMESARPLVTTTPMEQESMLIELFHMDDVWHEEARFIKYEEDVEGLDRRYGEPHIPFVFFDHIQFLRKCLCKGSVLVDVDATNFHDLCEIISKEVGGDNPVLVDNVFKLLLKDKDPVVERRRGLPRNSTVGVGGLLGLVPSQSAAPLGVMEKAHERTSFFRRSHDVGSVLGVRNNSDKPPMRTRSMFSSRLRSSELIAIKSDAELKTHYNSDLTDVAQVFVGGVEGMERYRFVMLRLKDTVQMERCREEVRFFFFFLGPPAGEIHFLELGKSLCTLLTNMEFKNIVYTATTGMQLVNGLDRFLNDTVILPPGEVDNKRLIPTEGLRIALKEREARRQKRAQTARAEYEKSLVENEQCARAPINYKYFNGMIKDAANRFPHYLSDFKDAFCLQTFTCIFYIFLAAITPALTFGGLMGKYTDGTMGMSETLLSQVISTFIWALFSCQPLIIQSPTGPVLIFEQALYNMCNHWEFDFLVVRLYSGIFVFLFSVVLVAFDGSRCLHYVTRFSEDIFAVLISFIFIIESGKFVIQAYIKDPVVNRTHYVNNVAKCSNSSFMENEDCPEPNTFLLTVIILFSTFGMAMILRRIRQSYWFGRHVRSFIGDFGVFIAISSVAIAMHYLFPDAHVQRLIMPETLGFTNAAKRGHGIFVIPFGKESIGQMAMSLAAAVLVFILLFMETGITEQLLLRKDFNLTKGGGMHFDILLMGLCTLISSMLGLPWMCAAAVQSIAHTTALTVTVRKAPGQRYGIVKVIEQRLTTMIVSFLIAGVTIFATKAKVFLLPVSSLFGVFLYLGVMNLIGVQLMSRVLLLITPIKYYPPVPYTKSTSSAKISLFTIIQLTLLFIITGVKLSSVTATLFPFVLICFVGIRHLVLPHIFSEKELHGLDNEENEEEDEDEVDFYAQVPIPV